MGEPKTPASRPGERERGRGAQRKGRRKSGRVDEEERDRAGKREKL